VAPRTNPEKRPQWYTGRGRTGRDHRRCGLAGRDHIDAGGVANSIAHLDVLECAADERASMHRIDGRAQYCEEIVSEV
jgi:hypothetical protein